MAYCHVQTYKGNLSVQERSVELAGEYKSVHRTERRVRRHKSLGWWLAGMGIFAEETRLNIDNELLC